MQTGRLAIIDLGTNTFHLLIADESKAILHEEKMPVKIGMGGINQDMITQAGIERTIDCLKQFSIKCRTYHVERIHAFGTSALRSAKNAAEVVERANAEAGIDIKVISGDEEARLIYFGVREAVLLGEEKSLIMDIGGGSVEFIIANESEIFWKKSIEIGGQRLFEKFHRHEPILHGELCSLSDHLEQALLPLRVPLEKHSPFALIGSSGTFETLSDIHCVRKGIANHQKPESPLDMVTFKEIYQELIGMDKSQRINMPGMMEWRAEMIVVTCALIDLLLSQHQFNQIKVSRYSLKEGILYSVGSL